MSAASGGSSRHLFPDSKPPERPVKIEWNEDLKVWSVGPWPGQPGIVYLLHPWGALFAPKEA